MHRSGRIPIVKQTAKHLGKYGATVYIVGRDQTRGLTAFKQLCDETGKSIPGGFIQMDLGSIRDTKRVADKFPEQRLDILGGWPHEPLNPPD